MNTALMPVPRLQFSDANGVPLAGGFVFSYAAGTTTLQATYQDALGAAANTNPIVLDAAGSASIWLTSATYKIVLQDLNGVVQWTQDDVSAVSQAELLGIASFASLAVTGGLTVGGDETVDGTLTAATLDITGTANVAGNLSATTAAVSGNETVGGMLAVTGATELTGAATLADALTVAGAAALTSLTVGGIDINALITSLIPVVAAVAGTLIITNVATAGNWVIFTFGATVGTRILIAFGAGSGIATGGSIPLPAGFTTTNLIAHAAIAAVSATAGNQLSQFACSVTAGVITVTAADSTGHSFTPTASWCACAWQTGV